jgi:hypothetical protein
MLLRRIATGTKWLTQNQKSNIFIYLRDHNKLINPVDSQLKLSYAHPASIVPDAPSQPKI